MSDRKCEASFFERDMFIFINITNIILLNEKYNLIKIYEGRRRSFSI